MIYENHFIDIGSQYGPHEIFKHFPGDNLIVMIDANDVVVKNSKRNYKYVNKLLMDKTDSTYNFKTRMNEGLSSIYDIQENSPFATLYDKNLLIDKVTKSLKSSTLDFEMKKLDIKPNFIKIDTEGSEDSIIAGSLNSLEQCWGMMIEVSFNSLYSGKGSNAHLIETVKKLDFNFINFYQGVKRIPQHILVNPVNYDEKIDDFGIVTSVDAIFLKNFENLNWEDSYIHKVSHLNFCFNNKLVDLGLKNLEVLISQGGSLPYSITLLENSDFSEIAWSTLLQIYRYLGKFRFSKKDPRFDVADNLVKSLFGINLLSGKDYWDFYTKIENKNF
jgi:FkbM family methyltransferase